MNIDVQFGANNPTPNQPWRPSVHGVVMNEKKEVLLHRREDHPLWALPGGKIELGESVIECLRREMKEETGLDVAAERLLGMYSSPEYTVAVKDAVTQPFFVVFLCRWEGGAVTLGTESQSFVWANKEKLAELDTLPLVKEMVRWAWSGRPDAFFGTMQLVEMQEAAGCFEASGRLSVTAAASDCLPDCVHARRKPEKRRPLLAAQFAQIAVRLRRYLARARVGCGSSFALRLRSGKVCFRDGIFERRTGKRGETVDE